MPRRRLKKVPKVVKTDSAETLRKELAKRKKEELVAALVELAKSDRRILRRLMAQFEVAAPVEELVAATRQATIDATDFDERDVNHNFGYDDKAYSEVKRNLRQLIDLGQLPRAMELSLELISAGSYQVEASDEGLMTEDIEECLKPVIKAIQKSNLPPTRVFKWCSEMLESDRVGFICDNELRTLRRKFQAATS